MRIIWVSPIKNKTDIENLQSRIKKEVCQIPEDEFLILTGETVINDLDNFLSYIRKISKESGAYIIFLNAEMIAGREHAELAMRLALKSFFMNRNPISNSFEMEVLLYAGGTRQCSEAILFGLHEGINRIYICIYPKIDDPIGLMNKFVTITSDESGHLSEEKYNRLTTSFKISDEEIGSVGHERIIDLVLERVALLDVYK